MWTPGLILRWVADTEVSILGPDPLPLTPCPLLSSFVSRLPRDPSPCPCPCVLVSGSENPEVCGVGVGEVGSGLPAVQKDGAY